MMPESKSLFDSIKNELGFTMQCPSNFTDCDQLIYPHQSCCGIDLQAKSYKCAPDSIPEGLKCYEHKGFSFVCPSDYDLVNHKSCRKILKENYVYECPVDFNLMSVESKPRQCEKEITTTEYVCQNSDYGLNGKCYSKVYGPWQCPDDFELSADEKVCVRDYEDDCSKGYTRRRLTDEKVGVFTVLDNLKDAVLGVPENIDYSPLKKIKNKTVFHQCTFEETADPTRDEDVLITDPHPVDTKSMIYENAMRICPSVGYKLSGDDCEKEYVMKAESVCDGITLNDRCMIETDLLYYCPPNTIPSGDQCATTIFTEKINKSLPTLATKTHDYGPHSKKKHTTIVGYGKEHIQKDMLIDHHLNNLMKDENFYDVAEILSKDAHFDAGKTDGLLAIVNKEPLSNFLSKEQHKLGVPKDVSDFNFIHDSINGVFEKPVWETNGSNVLEELLGGLLNDHGLFEETYEVIIDVADGVLGSLSTDVLSGILSEDNYKQMLPTYVLGGTLDKAGDEDIKVEWTDDLIHDLISGKVLKPAWETVLYSINDVYEIISQLLSADVLKVH